MSIDATILSTVTDGEDLILRLGPRLDRDDKPTCAGQDQMRIVGPRTWTPEPGMDIWGDSGRCQIVPASGNFNIPRWYMRDGYQRLREIAPTGSSLSPLPDSAPEGR